MTPKFRVWVPKFLKMCPVLEIRYKNNTNEEIEYIRIPSQSGFVPQGYAPFEFYLMQSTGLKDRNNKEIYEGDVLKVSSGRMFDIDEENPFIVVKWNEEAGAYTTKDFTGEFDDLNIGWQIADELIRVEVIGNIYENPELVSEFEEKLEK